MAESVRAHTRPIWWMVASQHGQCARRRPTGEAGAAGPRGRHRGPRRRCDHLPPAPSVPPLPRRRPLRGAAERPRAARARAAMGHSEGSTGTFTIQRDPRPFPPSHSVRGGRGARSESRPHSSRRPGAHCCAALCSAKKRKKRAVGATGCQWVGESPGGCRANPWLLDQNCAGKGRIPFVHLRRSRTSW